MSRHTAPISEVFSSLAGEGPQVGRRQVFLRTAGCHLDCSYCDTFTDPAEPCRFERLPGSGRLVEVANPLDLEAVFAMLTELEGVYPGHVHLAVTGGEPLLHAEFLLELLPRVKDELGLAVHLEYSGTLPEELRRVIDLCDVVACDIKPAGLCGRDVTGVTRRSLELCVAVGVELVPKVIFGRESDFTEVEAGVRLVAEIAPEFPVILQPVHGPGGLPDLSGPELLETLIRASRLHPDVRLIPQVHKLLAVR